MRKITQANSPIDKGGLKGSINYRIVRNHLLLRAGANYAQAVEFGTKPHRIEPKFANVLRWIDGGVPQYAKFVNHPGTKPTYFLKKSVLSYYGDVRLKKIV